jgi:hypothetical protein
VGNKIIKINAGSKNLKAVSRNADESVNNNIDDNVSAVKKELLLEGLG